MNTVSYPAPDGGVYVSVNAARRSVCATISQVNYRLTRAPYFFSGGSPIEAMSP